MCCEGISMGVFYEPGDGLTRSLHHGIEKHSWEPDESPLRPLKVFVVRAESVWEYGSRDRESYPCVLRRVPDSLWSDVCVILLFVAIFSQCSIFCFGILFSYSLHTQPNGGPHLSACMHLSVNGIYICYEYKCASTSNEETPIDLFSPVIPNFQGRLEANSA